jgi:hypothetical protein
MQKIDIQLEPSRIFSGLIVIVCVGCISITLSLSLGWILKIVLMMSELAYCSWILWVHGRLLSPSSVVGLQLLAEGQCYLKYPLRIIEAKIRGDSTVTTAVCVLRFKIPDKRRAVSCVIFKDSMEREMYRKLLVWLRCADSL